MLLRVEQDSEDADDERDHEVMVGVEQAGNELPNR
jgi:hypothetical protein